MALAAAVWWAVFRATPSVGTYDFREMMSYYLLVRLMSSVVFSGNVATAVGRDIQKGDLDRYLCRPADYQGLVVASATPGALVNLALQLLGYTVIARLLGLAVQRSMLANVAFAISMMLSFLMFVFTYFIVGCSAFWTGTVMGIRELCFRTIMLLGGHLVPLDILPVWLRRIAMCLPFQCLYYLPYKIYSASGAATALINLTYQVAWVVAFYVASRFVWHRGIGRYSSQGG
jgi:ABC-2 type transport system permease protein